MMVYSIPKWEHDLSIYDIQDLTFTCLICVNPRLWIFGVTLPMNSTLTPANEKT